MATIINNPRNGEVSDSPAIVFMSLMLLAVIVGLFVVFGMPYMREDRIVPVPTSGTDAINVEVNLPEDTTPSAPTPAPTPSPLPVTPSASAPA